MFRSFLYSISQKLAQFMYGRYGNDALTRFLSIFCLVLFLIYIITRIFVFYALSIFLVFWSVFRSLSRNFSARQKELGKFLDISEKIKRWFNLRKRIFSERKTTKYYKCKNCKAFLRVPKGRGKLEISCPKCKYTFIKRT